MPSRARLIALGGLLAAIVVVCAVAPALRSGGAGAAAERLRATGRERFEETLGAEAIRFRRLQESDENGGIPANALVDAKAHIDAMEQAPAPARPGNLAGPTLDAGISQATWDWLGPGNIGGRIRSILIDPANAATMWVGSVSGGIFKSTDGGATWAHADDFLPSLAVSSLVAPAGSTSTIYAGTGERLGDNRLDDGIRGAGVLKSTDGGATWSQLPSTTSSDWWYVNRLAVSPTSATTLLAATWSGIWQTTNGGALWTKQDTRYAQDIDYHPTDPNQAIAGGFNGTALYTVDGGASWQAATGIPTAAGGRAGRVEVAYARGNPSITYASVDIGDGTLYRSTDGGHSYTLVNAGPYLGGQGDYGNALWVSPTNENRVIVGGVDLYESTDGGATLTQISDWSVHQDYVLGTSAVDSAHADQHAIVEVPGYGAGNAIVFFGNDGGVFKADVTSVTPTSGWQPLNNNLGLTQLYGAAGNASSGVLVGGAQDNGSLRYSGNANQWHMWFGGDGGYVQADPTDPQTFYGEYVYGDVFRSTDGGDTGTEISGVTDYTPQGDFVCAKAAQYEIADVCNKSANFIAPIALDPGNPQRLLVGGLSLWRTNDARTALSASAGPTWTAIKAPLSNNSPISAIAIATTNPDLVYVGYNDGEIWRSTNATAASPTWNEVDLAAMPARFVLGLTIDPTNTDVVYALFGGYAGDNVWRLSDGGTNWVDRTGSGLTGLPSVPVRSLAVLPSNPNWLYVGTEVGVFASTDAGATWTVPSGGPANVPVDQVFMMNGKLFAATFGRGLWQTNIVTAPPPSNDPFAGALTLTGSTVSRAADTNVGAGKEAGEPYHAGNPGGASVWYRWTAPASGTTTVDTSGSSFDTLLGVYTGDSVGGLTQIAANDDESYPDIRTSKLTFPASAGVTYRIAVDGYKFADTAVKTGTIALHLAAPEGAATQSLTVTRAGSGTGTVTSTPAGINCGSTCAASFASGASVTLSAAPAAGSSFAGWSGACTGTGTCSLTMDGAKAVTATFAKIQQTLTVARSGSGSGTVTSAPAGINCGATCSAPFDAGATVTLTASPAAGSSFTGWSGACSGAGGCQVTMDAARSVTATFTRLSYVLTIGKSGSGSGLVSSAPGGIACGANCAASFDAGTQVALAASAAADSSFAGWSGPCSGTGACIVSMDGARSVTATFSKLSYTLTVTKGGAGAGSVTSVPGAIDCGGACSATVEAGTVLTLTASAAGGSTFAGWGGGCTGTGSCVVTMDSAKAVTATFAKARQTLTVATNGTGTGTVTSSPAGISCGAACSLTADAGTVVALAASPGASSTFGGWGGACSGTGSCTVTLDAAKAVTATFVAVVTTPTRVCVVPSLVGRTLAAARSALARAHCRLGAVAYAYSKKVARGRVVAQSARPGRHLAAGTRVAVTISKGKAKAKRR